jgi:hypothetical protein
MSSMLEQAIIDAKMLREAASKNAENQVIERYASEVKEAVERLLEEDPLGFEEEELDGGLDMDMGLEEPAEDPAVDAAVMSAIPAGHESGDDEVVTIDLDAIIAAAESEESNDEDIMDRESIADEVGIPELADEEQALDPGFSEDELAANRTNEKINHKDELENDEIEINEEELQRVFQEMLTVNVPNAAEEALAEIAEIEGDDAEEEEEEEAPQAADGQDPAELEESKSLNTKLQADLQESATKNKELLELLGQAKERLQEINLSNARLFYTNRVLNNGSLNERQRKQMAEHLQTAQSVDEAKTIFETLQRTVGNGDKVAKANKSLSEAVTKNSSARLRARQEVTSTIPTPQKSRWAHLAGIN